MSDVLRGEGHHIDIALFTKKLSEAKQQHSTIDLELYAIGRLFDISDTI